MFNYNKRGEKTGKLHSPGGNGCRVVLAIPFLLFGLIGGLMAACGVFVSGYRAEAILGGWSTSGTKILDPSGGNFIISGINWYGFETRGVSCFKRALDVLGAKYRRQLRFVG